MRGEEYQVLISQAMIGVVKSAISKSLNDGTTNFFITFNTQHPGVQITEDLKTKYPSQMSIILQNKFESLNILNDHFTVVLTFSGVKKFLSIPFNALTYFLDRESNYAIELHHVETDDSDHSEPSPSNKIISLDKYKR